MSGARPRCGACAHFSRDGATLEAALPGLASLGSGHASTRGGDGLCRLHDRFAGAGGGCDGFRDALDAPGATAHFQSVPRRSPARG